MTSPKLRYESGRSVRAQTWFGAWWRQVKQQIILSYQFLYSCFQWCHALKTTLLRLISAFCQPIFSRPSPGTSPHHWLSAKASTEGLSSRHDDRSAGALLPFGRAFRGKSSKASCAWRGRNLYRLFNLIHISILCLLLPCLSATYKFTMKSHSHWVYEGIVSQVVPLHQENQKPPHLRSLHHRAW